MGTRDGFVAFTCACACGGETAAAQPAAQPSQPHYDRIGTHPHQRRLRHLRRQRRGCAGWRGWRRGVAGARLPPPFPRHHSVMESSSGGGGGHAARALFARVAVACGYIFLLEGTTFGFSSLRPLYVAAGVFAAACDGAPPPAPPPAAGEPLCDAQAARLAALLTTGAAVGDLVALAVGLVVWSVGRRVAFTASSVLMAAGFAALGCGAAAAPHLPLEAQAAALHGGFVIIAVGHSVLFNATLLYAGELKTLADGTAAALHPYATGMIAGSYTLSTLTPLAVAAAVTAAGSTVLAAYAVFFTVAVSMAAFAVFADPPVSSAAAASALLPLRRGGWAGARAAFMDAVSHWREIRHAAVWVVWLWAAVSTVAMNWYQATVADQVAYFAGSDTTAAQRLTTAFNVMLPLCGALGNAAFTLLLPTPAAAPRQLAAALRRRASTAPADAGDDGAARLLDHDAARDAAVAPPPPPRTAWRGMALATVGIVVWGVPALLPSPWLQLLPMAVFSAWRSGIFVTFYHHVIEAFAPAALLLLVNGESMLAGTLAFINVPLRDAVTAHGPALYTWITAAYVVAATVLAAAALATVAPRRRCCS